MKKVGPWRSIIGWAMSLFSVLGIVSSGMAKLMQAEPLVESLKAINLDHHIVTIGVIELICVALYLIPKTSKIGFYLLCSYIGGIIAAEWAMGNTPTIGIVIGIMTYVGTMLRRPEMSGLDI